MDYNKLTIKEANLALKMKKFSAEELLNDCLDQISKEDGDYNSFINVYPEYALKKAKEVDEKIAKGLDIDDLEGIPVAVKDIIAVKGLKNTCASSIMQDFVAPYSATVVEKLEEKGAVILGKTNTDEFACGGSTEHSYFGVTKNAYDLDRVAGGSSGGSAVALAKEMALYSLGTDTGGSIRQPASFNNVYGLKVSYGRVSRSGVTSMASSWDTVGPFAKTPYDLAVVMESIAGKDRRDMTTSDKKVLRYRDYLDGDLSDMTLGVPKEYFSDGVESETKERVMESVKRLEGLGVSVKEISLPSTDYAVAAYYVMMSAELSANLERFDGIRYGKKAENYADMVDYYFQARGQGFGDEVKRRIMLGTYVLSAGYFDAYYKKALKVRRLILNDFEKVFKEVDFLVSPVSPFPAFKIDEFMAEPLKMYMADALTIPASAAGLCALSVPSGFDKAGLPIGMQVIAGQFKEELLLNVANRLYLEEK